MGSERVLDSPEILNAYRKDYSLTPPGTPILVVFPENSNEIQSIVTLANEYAIPIIPCSSRVHFFGTTIPKQGGIVLDLKKMNRIWDLDEEDLTKKDEWIYITVPKEDIRLGLFNGLSLIHI